MRSGLARGELSPPWPFCHSSREFFLNSESCLSAESGRCPTLSCSGVLELGEAGRADLRVAGPAAGGGAACL
jgi:hypothetical protein